MQFQEDRPEGQLPYLTREGSGCQAAGNLLVYMVILTPGIRYLFAS